jgi:hypothetical protein
MGKKVKISIVATVTAEVELREGETTEDLKKRYVDIYLHDAGQNGYNNKTDLGGSAVIEIIQ